MDTLPPAGRVRRSIEHSCPLVPPEFSDQNRFVLSPDTFRCLSLLIAPHVPIPVVSPMVSCALSAGVRRKLAKSGEGHLCRCFPSLRIRLVGVNDYRWFRGCVRHVSAGMPPRTACGRVRLSQLFQAFLPQPRVRSPWLPHGWIAFQRSKKNSHGRP